ncbi:MAG: hypothetical protein K8J08_06000, partial [Thermoanaerobaculia bacterium]|nr:hypothetical protein [Thermoanaerobaculia bacterium]
MTQSSHLKCLAVLFGIGLLVAPVNAFKEPEPTPVSSKSYQHADLYIGNVFVTVDSLDASKAATAQQALARLGGSADSARIDRRSGRWGTLISSVPLLPGTGVGNELSWAQQPGSLQEIESAAREAFLGYLTQHAADLGIDSSELGGVKVTVHDNGNLIQLYVNRQLAGVPVLKSYITATINHGNLILMGAHQWGDLDVAPEPAVALAEAEVVLNGHLGNVAPERTRKNQLAIVPMAHGVDYLSTAIADGYSYRLAWILHPEFSDEMGEWEAIVDANTGELLAFRDIANYASTREAKGGVYPISNDGVAPDGVEQAGWPMPFAYVTNQGVARTATTGGQVMACVNGASTTALTGPYLTMTDTCGAIAESSAMTPGDVLDLEFGPGTDCVVPAGHSAGDTHASRSGFYEINKIIEMGRGQLPGNTWLRQPLPATMNIAQNCNASGGPGGLSFFTSGGGCANTGELAGVFDHEWGHGMDGADATPGISSPGEGIADIYASLRYNQSCIGRNFLSSACGGYGDPCVPPAGGGPACTGVRDIDWDNRASHTRHDLTWIDGCGSGSCNGPCGGSCHCEGAVYAEAVWDLWNREFVSAPTNLDLDTARETATRLTFAGAGAVGDWYSCTNGSGGDGCNADGGYLNYLAADDDDGNFANGTPHMQDIFDVFNDHG